MRRRMAPVRALLLPLTLLALSSLVACENEEAPKPEPRVAPAAASPVQAKAETHAGACGMEGEKAEAKQGGGCGQMAKEEAPTGCGCGSHDTGSADKPVVPITQAKLGDRTRCPVTNSVFVIKSDSPKTDFGGKTYHFCCDGCVSKFKQDPKQFLEG